jgi:hypothetical protein
MMPNTFDVIPKRKRLVVFKVGKLWLFKQFFDNREVFEAMLGHYNKDSYRFEFKTTGERNNALKILERNGFDYDLVDGCDADLSLFVLAFDLLRRFVMKMHTLSPILNSCR